MYDGDDPDVFLERLDLRIKAHDKEIERMCNYHYQGFIESIRSLLQVRTDADNLKVNIHTNCSPSHNNQPFLTDIFRKQAILK